MRQEQFLEVVDRDQAERLWYEALDISPLGLETVPLEEALDRVLGEDVCATVDVPSFDRSNMDGFALRAEDTFGASEETPIRLAMNEESIPTGVVPRLEVTAATASAIATGGMLPRGADAVVPVEMTDVDGAEVVVLAACVPGSSVSYAGSDMATGEIVIHAGTLLTSRETGVLAAIGASEARVMRRPRIGVVSTGDEIVAPGEAMRPGLIYDSNGRILSDALREIGAEPVFLGVFRDDVDALRRVLDDALRDCDGVLLSGGTSKGEGDLCYRVVSELEPGIQVHGVALKPGKPICLASAGGKPVAILPGFPTSAVFTFHELVAPLVRRLSGRRTERRATVRALLAQTVRTAKGRLEYLLVSLVRGTAGGPSQGGLVAFPMGKGSGSVTAFSRADGFIRIDRTTEIVEAGAELEVNLLTRVLEPADLVVIGSHCLGLDVIARRMVRDGLSVKLIAAGSQGGLAAASRGECDVAPIHLLDAERDEYNRPFLGEGLELVEGYRRMQGVVTRQAEARATAELVEDGSLRMVNRNRGSGTRVLIDQLLRDRRPDGYSYQPRSHHAVAAAVTQGRADWGVTIETVARQSGLRFRPLREEHYDFAIPRDRLDLPAVQAFLALLRPGGEVRRQLEELGFTASRRPRRQQHD